jgi:hypothetical protein
MSAVDTAVITKLQGAAAVTAAAPGGVYWDVAPDTVENFPVVIISLRAHNDTYEMGGGHFEVGRYAVKAVGIGTNSSQVANAAAAIHAALHNQTITAAGYTHMLCHRDPTEGRIRYVEVDGSQRFQHQGAVYAVWSSR